jgi:hypothetical protein
MKSVVLAAVAAVLTISSAEAETDCRIRALPPASYASKPMPPVKYQAMPLAQLQKLYRQYAGLPRRAAGLDYCADPIGFVYPWETGVTPTIYYPTDVTPECKREVLAHEQAHVKGWPMNHPGAHLQNGPCHR